MTSIDSTRLAGLDSIPPSDCSLAPGDFSQIERRTRFRLPSSRPPVTNRTHGTRPRRLRAPMCDAHNTSPIHFKAMLGLRGSAVARAIMTMGAAGQRWASWSRRLHCKTLTRLNARFKDASLAETTSEGRESATIWCDWPCLLGAKSSGQSWWPSASMHFSPSSCRDGICLDASVGFVRSLGSPGSIHRDHARPTL